MCFCCILKKWRLWGHWRSLGVPEGSLGECGFGSGLVSLLGACKKKATATATMTRTTTIPLIRREKKSNCNQNQNQNRNHNHF